MTLPATQSTTRTDAELTLILSAELARVKRLLEELADAKRDLATTIDEVERA